MDYKDAIPESSVVFIAVGTPPKENGEADLSSVFEVVRKIAPYLNGYTVIATKSTGIRTGPTGKNWKYSGIIKTIGRQI